MCNFFYLLLPQCLVVLSRTNSHKMVISGLQLSWTQLLSTLDFSVQIRFHWMWSTKWTPLQETSVTYGHLNLEPINHHHHHHLSLIHSKFSLLGLRTSTYQRDHVVKKKMKKEKRCVLINLGHPYFMWSFFSRGPNLPIRSNQVYCLDEKCLLVQTSEFLD